MRALTKSELIDKVFARHGSLTNREADEAVNEILKTIISFSLKHRAARTGRNPRTGATVEVPAKFVPHFRAGKEIRDAMNGRAGVTPLK